VSRPTQRYFARWRGGDDDDDNNNDDKKNKKKLNNNLKVVYIIKQYYYNASHENCRIEDGAKRNFQTGTIASSELLYPAAVLYIGIAYDYYTVRRARNSCCCGTLL